MVRAEGDTAEDVDLDALKRERRETDVSNAMSVYSTSPSVNLPRHDLLAYARNSWI